MKIRELHLTNYRAFKEYSLNFSDQFTVIAGINGKGKTTILEALALLISRVLPQISPAKGGYRSFSPEDIHAKTESTSLMLKANCAGIPITFEGRYAKNQFAALVQRFDTLADQVQRSIRTAYGQDKTRSDDAAPIAVYYTTDRAGFSLPRSLAGASPLGQAAAYHRALVKKKVDFKDFMRWYRAFLVQIEKDPPNLTVGDRRTMETIERALREFLHDFGQLHVEENPPRLRIAKSGVRLDLGQLSDGERSFLAIVTDLCKRLIRANPQIDPLIGEGVVLIDELELHLHPTWQREIVEKLRRTFPKIQFITTTHSPFVIQSLRSGELVNLDPNEFADTATMGVVISDQVQQPEYSDKSVEDIAEQVMGVDMPQKSVRYQQMMKAAEEYFKLLRASPNFSSDELASLKRRLQALSEPFSDDPAYQALLKVERETTLGGDPNASG